MCHPSLLTALLLTFLGLAGPVAGVTLDWDTQTWNPGDLTNTFDIDPAHSGNDITVTISGDTNRLIADSAAPNPATPALVTSLGGGLAVAEKSLLLHLNLTNQAEAVAVSVSFSAQYTLGVQDVSFTIFDVDFASAGFQDQLRSIQGLSVDGITLIAPTITTSSANSVTGAGLGQVVNGDSNAPNSGAGSGNGSVTISFGNNAIRSFGFTYGSGSIAPVDPTTQKIGIHDISFTPVPEMNPAWCAGISCLVATAVILSRRTKVSS